MNAGTLNLLPRWVRDNTVYDMVLTNDLDSLISCAVLSKVNNWVIKYFYDFKKVYHTDTLNKENAHSRVWVDCAVLKIRDKYEKGFDNHVTMLSTDDYKNPELVNLNNIYDITTECREDYLTKYNLSTALLVWSLYNIPIPKSEEGKMILLAVDSSHKGFYSKYENDRQRNKHWLVDILELPELYECLQRHTEQDFKDIIKKYNLAREIKLEWDSFEDFFGERIYDEWLEIISNKIEISLALPTDKFVEWKSYKTNYKQINREENKDEINSKLFSLAVTGYNKISYSYIA